jgi:tRNA-splicing ligase RtcB
MFTMQGKYASAVIMTELCDEATQQQIATFLNHPASQGSNVVIMPDTHAGAGCVIGLTMTLTDLIIPNLVGVDIGCGVEAYKLSSVSHSKVDFADVDKWIHEVIPTGGTVREKVADWESSIKDGSKLSAAVQATVNKLATDPKIKIDERRVYHSIGTLGGGNHFIEIDIDHNGDYWLVMHTGSRNFGYKIAMYHQNRAKEYISKKYNGASAYNTLEFLPLDEGGSEYLADMKIAQKYAEANRHVIAQEIVHGYFGNALDEVACIKSVHNYISFDDKILRKGAIVANANEKCIIPLNMRSGCLLCTGKGNKSWNMSAPHGAGRTMSRGEAHRTLSVEDFVNEMMEGKIYTSCVGKNTLDEAPAAYKDPAMIMRSITGTVTINDHILPVYSFKDATGGYDKKTKAREND